MGEGVPDTDGKQERAQLVRVPSPEVDGNHKHNEQRPEANSDHLDAQAGNCEVWIAQSHCGLLSVNAVTVTANSIHDSVKSM